jgi:hypothetical protein
MLYLSAARLHFREVRVNQRAISTQSSNDDDRTYILTYRHMDRQTPVAFHRPQGMDDGRPVVRCNFS